MNVANWPGLANDYRSDFEHFYVSGRIRVYRCRHTDEALLAVEEDRQSPKSDTAMALDAQQGLLFALRDVLELQRDGRVAEASARAQDLMAEREQVALIERVVGPRDKTGEDFSKAYRQLGKAFERISLIDEAMECYRAAIVSNSRDTDAINRLTYALCEQSQYDDAIGIARRAVEEGCDDYYTNKIIAMCFSGRGERSEAETWTRRALGLQPYFNIAAMGNANDGRLRALVLGNLEQSQELCFEVSGSITIAGGQTGSIPHLVSKEHFVDVVVFLHHGIEPEALKRRLLDFDIVVNGMSDPDTHADMLRLFEPVIRASGIPTINPPHRVLANGRDSVYRLLNSIDGVLAPRTQKVFMQATSAHPLRVFLENNEFKLPVILRPTGSHAGRNMIRIASAADWDRAEETFATDYGNQTIYITSFVDYADNDGLYSKFRVFCVGDEFIATHYMTCDDWNVHWENARAMMAREPALVEREIDFLQAFDEKWRNVLDGRLQEIRRAIGLDFFGMDCGLTRDGELLIFEANASMVLTSPGREEKFPYLAPYIARVKGSFLEMVHRRLSGR